MHERRLFEVNRWGKDHDELLLVRASKSKQCGDFGRTGGTTRYGRHNLDAVDWRKPPGWIGPNWHVLTILLYCCTIAAFWAGKNG